MTLRWLRECWPSAQQRNVDHISSRQEHFYRKEENDANASMTDEEVEFLMDSNDGRPTEDDVQRLIE